MVEHVGLINWHLGSTHCNSFKPEQFSTSKRFSSLKDTWVTFGAYLKLLWLTWPFSWLIICKLLFTWLACVARRRLCRTQWHLANNLQRSRWGLVSKKIHWFQTLADCYRQTEIRLWGPLSSVPPTPAWRSRSSRHSAQSVDRARVNIYQLPVYIGKLSQTTLKCTEVWRRNLARLIRLTKKSVVKARGQYNPLGSVCGSGLVRWTYINDGFSMKI